MRIRLSVCPPLNKFSLHSSLRCFRFIASVVVAVYGSGLSAQTNPVAQPLPYSQGFGTASFTALPTGVAAWNGLNGGSVTSAISAAASAATGDATLAGATAAQTTGGSFGYASSGNGRFYIQTSSSTSNGANQLAVALDTTLWNAITLDYDVEIVSAQARTVGVICQYRVGTGGAWTTLAPATGANPFSQAGGTGGVKTSPHIVLPMATENQPVVQVRWSVWRGTETGNSSGAAIDNIAISGSAASTVLFATLSTASVVENAGANATTLTVSRTGNTASALPVTLLISDATEAAYDGPNPLEIPAGQSSVTFPIRAVDDADNDGTQTVLLHASAPAAISTTTTLSVLDNEDVNSPPTGHYDAAAGLIGTPLKAALKTIASPANYQTYSYADTYGPLRTLWEDPNNPANVITVYSGTSIGKTVTYYPGGPSPDVSWSREHVWPESFGLDPANVNPGGTGGDAGPDFTDLFNLRPCLQTVNLLRSNLYYDASTGTPLITSLAPLCTRDVDSWEPRDVNKGELARTILYMATRYDGTDANTMDLEIADTPSTALARFARLSTLLRWNEEHPVTVQERQRNQSIFANYQHNRNPFIDHPEYINLIWGNVRIEKLAASVAEAGATDGYTVALATQPTADVTVMVNVSAISQIGVSPVSLTFTPTNWNHPQSVSISAVNDTAYEPTLTARVQHSIASADPRYAALVPLDVIVTVTDDDPIFPPAVLPITYGGPWDLLPTGFLSSGLGAPYATSLGGDAATGSAKFDSTGDQLTLRFNSAPATLSYQLKGSPGSGTATAGSFIVQQSADGATFIPLRTVTNKDNTDQAYTDTLSPSTRYVAFIYSEKISGNIQCDKLSITAAPPFETWASTFGINGPDANPLNDYDHDGVSNLMEYALGGSPITADASQHQPLLEKTTGKLHLTAVIRTNDTTLGYSAQTSTALTDANGWTTAGVSQLTSIEQTGVPLGFERAIFEVDDNGGTQRFLRLRVDRTP